MSLSTDTMSVLPAQEIAAEIAQGRLVRNSSPSNLQACSYDLRIGTIFKDGQAINGAHANAGMNVVLKPGDVLSMFTLEELVLPANICATVFPINSQSSRGLLVLNPGHVDPGYDGPITVKVLNISKSEMIIRIGEPIFTVIFDMLTVVTNRPYPVNAKTRGTREIEFAERDMNVSPVSLVKLIGEPNALEIDRMIRSHWMAKWSLILTAGALIFAVIAAMPVFREAVEKVRSPATVTNGRDPGTAPEQSAVPAPVPAKGNASAASGSRKG
jgi:deoxycytidine triphosphate deaminase